MYDLVLIVIVYELLCQPMARGIVNVMYLVTVVIVTTVVCKQHNNFNEQNV